MSYFYIVFLLSLSFISASTTADSCTTIMGDIGVCSNIEDCPHFQEEPFSNTNISIPSIAYCDFAKKMVCCPKRRTKRYALSYQNCGISGSRLLNKVINGVKAGLGTWPWIAALGFKKRGNIHWGCGGSLITERHVLTAGHCIRRHENQLSVVRLGELDLKDHRKGARPVDYRISKMIVHKHFDSTTHENDIGLLKLTSRVTFTNYIRPICLPTSTSMRGDTYVNKMPFIAGWGAISNGGPSASHLQQAQVPVVSNHECKRNYARTRFVIDGKVICAGYKRGGTDTCQGDSGGPLMYPVTSRRSSSIQYYLIGITSFGYECGRAGYPGVYMRVGSFIPWIQSNINS